MIGLKDYHDRLSLRISKLNTDNAYITHRSLSLSQYCSLLAAGFADGSVMVYDVRSPSSPFAISSTMDGKHILPVTQVK